MQMQLKLPIGLLASYWKSPNGVIAFWQIPVLIIWNGKYDFSSQLRNMLHSHKQQEEKSWQAAKNLISSDVLRNLSGK